MRNFVWDGKYQKPTLLHDSATIESGIMYSYYLSALPIYLRHLSSTFLPPTHLALCGQINLTFTLKKYVVLFRTSQVYTGVSNLWSSYSKSRKSCHHAGKLIYHTPKIYMKITYKGPNWLQRCSRLLGLQQIEIQCSVSYTPYNLIVLSNLVLRIWFFTSNVKYPDYTVYYITANFNIVRRLKMISHFLGCMHIGVYTFLIAIYYTSPAVTCPALHRASFCALLCDRIITRKTCHKLTVCRAAAASCLDDRSI